MKTTANGTHIKYRSDKHQKLNQNLRLAKKQVSVLLKTINLHKVAVLPKNLQPLKNSNLFPFIDLLHDDMICILAIFIEIFLMTPFITKKHLFNDKLTTILLDSPFPNRTETVHYYINNLIS